MNPNQPSHRINTPIVTNGIEEAAKGLIAFASPLLSNRPDREPSKIIPASAAAPPVECTKVEPAKSEKPSSAHQPPPHCQPITIG